MSRIEDLEQRTRLTFTEAQELQSLRVALQKKELIEQKRIQSLIDDGNQIFTLHYTIGNTFQDPKDFRPETSQIWAHDPIEASAVAIRKILAKESTPHMLTGANYSLDIARVDQRESHEAVLINPNTIVTLQRRDEISTEAEKILETFHSLPQPTLKP